MRSSDPCDGRRVSVRFQILDNAVDQGELVPEVSALRRSRRGGSVALVIVRVRVPVAFQNAAPVRAELLVIGEAHEPFEPMNVAVLKFRIGARPVEEFDHVPARGARVGRKHRA